MRVTLSLLKQITSLKKVFKMKELELLNEIIRDVESSNNRRNKDRKSDFDRESDFLSWKNWNANDIFDCYDNCSKKAKEIIRRAIKTDGASLDSDIKKWSY
jgi:hypothetical protein